MKKMKAIVMTGYGSHEVLKLRQVDQPIAGPNEVLVKVITSAATRADTMMRMGKPFLSRLILGLSKPSKPIPGTGFAGVTQAIGAEVSTFKIGDRVFGETAFGFSANAEYISVTEAGVIMKLPEHMDFHEAANFCDGHLTSYNFLKEIAQIKPGQQILINGASGALGTSAVQIATYLGAEVTAVCSSANFGLVKSLGAEHVINYQEEDFTLSKKTYDFVYDTVGKSSFKACKQILKEKGVYLSPVLQFPLLLDMISTSIAKGKKAKFEATGANKVKKLNVLLSEVLDIYQAGKLKTIIDRQFPLEKLAEAHQYIDSGRKKGNVVIYNT